MAHVREKTMASSAPKVVRPMGHVERYMEAQYYHDQFCGTAVTCRYALPDGLVDMSKHKEAQARIIRAVARTILDHPLMQVGISGERTRKPDFIRLDSINLDDIIEWSIVSPSEDYAAFADKALNEQLDRKFTNLDTWPGWRMSVLRPEGSPFMDIVFNFRHTMGDGIGAKIFHRSLLGHLNQHTGDPEHLGLQGNILHLQGNNVNYPPPVDAMGKFTLTPGFAITNAWRELKPSFLAKRPTPTQRSWGSFKAGPAKTERRTIRIGAEKANKILKACRAHQTTVTGLLHGIVFASLLWETRSTGYTASFDSSTAIDLRRFLPPKPPGVPGVEMDPHKTIANLVTVLDHEFDASKVEELSKKMKEPVEGQGMAHLEDIVWTVAQSVRTELQAKLDRGLKNDIMAMMKFVGDWREEKARALKKPRRESWQVTNLGAVDGVSSTGETDHGSAWRIERAVFSLSAETARPLFVLSAVSVKGGDMCVDAIWQADLNDYVDGIAARLAPDIYGWLNYIATSEWQENDLPPAFGDDLL